MTISLVIKEASTLALYRASEPDLDPEMLAVVDGLIEKGPSHAAPEVGRGRRRWCWRAGPRRRLPALGRRLSVTWR